MHRRTLAPYRLHQVRASHSCGKGRWVLGLFFAAGCAVGPPVSQAQRLAEARHVAAMQQHCPEERVVLKDDYTQDHLEVYWGPFLIRKYEPDEYFFVLSVCGQPRCYVRNGAEFHETPTEKGPCKGLYWRDIRVLLRKANDS
jgi:hypothetical protein